MIQRTILALTLLIKGAVFLIGIYIISAFCLVMIIPSIISWIAFENDIYPDLGELCESLQEYLRIC